jgi:hypothetical protein
VGTFIHEIVHMPSGQMDGFKRLWTVMVGVPLLMPWVIYRNHIEHHNQHIALNLQAHIPEKASAKKAVGSTKVVSGAAAKKAAAKTKTGVGKTAAESDVTPVG